MTDCIIHTFVWFCFKSCAHTVTDKITSNVNKSTFHCLSFSQSKDQHHNATVSPMMEKIMSVNCGTDFNVKLQMFVLSQDTVQSR